MLTLKKPIISKLPGGWEPPEHSFKLEDKTKVEKNDLFENAFVLKNVFSERECDDLISLMNQSPNFHGVSIQGRLDIPDERIGSRRTTMWSPELADQFWLKFSKELDTKRSVHNYTSTDWWQNSEYRHWEPYSISPLLRFMKYENGGQHFAHYDAGYIYPDSRYRTLMSFVVYLTTNNEGGSTRFIKDKQDNLPIWKRNHDDWIREAEDHEVICTVPPVKGSILVFDHRICHDVEKYTGTDPRIIIRGDITFKAFEDGLEN